jgi:5-formyltetrahydrofolate cyclo-ligase
MAMAPVTYLDNDLGEGSFVIREPGPEARTGAAPEPDLVLVPGLGFDLRGGRLGKGKGFYDRYLAGRNALKAGLSFDVQITETNLTLDAHDQLMDAVVTEKRTLVFSAPRTDAA